MPRRSLFFLEGAFTGLSQVSDPQSQKHLKLHTNANLKFEGSNCAMIWAPNICATGRKLLSEALVQFRMSTQETRPREGRVRVFQLFQDHNPGSRHMYRETAPACRDKVAGEMAMEPVAQEVFKQRLLFNSSSMLLSYHG